MFTMYTISKHSQCVFLKQTKSNQKSDLQLIGNFAYPHNLYTVVELHTSVVLIHFESQTLFHISFCQRYLNWGNQYTADQTTSTVNDFKYFTKTFRISIGFGIVNKDSLILMCYHSFNKTKVPWQSSGQWWVRFTPETLVCDTTPSSWWKLLSSYIIRI